MVSLSDQFLSHRALTITGPTQLNLGALSRGAEAFLFFFIRNQGCASGSVSTTPDGQSPLSFPHDLLMLGSFALLLEKIDYFFRHQFSDTDRGMNFSFPIQPPPLAPRAVLRRSPYMTVSHRYEAAEERISLLERSLSRIPYLASKRFFTYGSHRERFLI